MGRKSGDLPIKTKISGLKKLVAKLTFKKLTSGLNATESHCNPRIAIDLCDVQRKYCGLCALQKNKRLLQCYTLFRSTHANASPVICFL